MLIKLTAKVLLEDEDMLEVESKYDMGSIAKSKEWVWRSIGVPVSEMYKIIEYNKSKSIVQMRDNEKILVAEPFQDLFNRWSELREKDVYEDGEKEEESSTQHDDEVE